MKWYCRVDLRAQDSSCSWLLSILRSLKANKKTLKCWKGHARRKCSIMGHLWWSELRAGGNTDGSPCRVGGWRQNNETFVVWQEWMAHVKSVGRSYCGRCGAHSRGDYGGLKKGKKWYSRKDTTRWPLGRSRRAGSNGGNGSKNGLRMGSKWSNKERVNGL